MIYWILVSRSVLHLCSVFRVPKAHPGATMLFDAFCMGMLRSSYENSGILTQVTYPGSTSFGLALWNNFIPLFIENWLADFCQDEWLRSSIHRSSNHFYLLSDDLNCERFAVFSFLFLSLGIWFIFTQTFFWTFSLEQTVNRMLNASVWCTALVSSLSYLPLAHMNPLSAKLPGPILLPGGP